MGMAASQARLLTITARLSNNEQEQQSVAYSKQRLAEDSNQINQQYLDAMSKTKYQILTGYNSSEATYADLTYNQITGLNSVATGKQYIVKDKMGKVLVTSAVAKAYEENNGDFNRFLRDLGYTQSDVDVTDYSGTEEAIHEAWDKYLASVGKSIDNYEDGQHILGFDYTSFSSDSFDGYPTYNTAYASVSETDNYSSIFKDSNGYYKERYLVQAITDDTGAQYCGYQTAEQEGSDEWTILDNVTYNTETEQFMYQNLEGEIVSADTVYADPEEDLISENYKNYLTPNGEYYISEGGTAYDVYKQSAALNFEGTTTAQRELYDYAVAITEAYYNNKTSATSQTLTYDSQVVNYYKNIFNQMRETGYTTTPNETNLKENSWLVNQLKAGELVLAYYSTVEKGFVNTTLDDDESIVEKEDSSAMAIAEQEYQARMDKIESQDKQFDLQLNKLSTEHNELQTEYDAVKKVISNNVEKSFNIFNA